MIGGSRQSVNRLLADLVSRDVLRFDGDELVIPDSVPARRRRPPMTDDPWRRPRGARASARPLSRGGSPPAIDSLPDAQDALLPAVARTAAIVLDAEAASIAIHDPATDRLVFRAAAGPTARRSIGLAIEATAGIAGYAFATGSRWPSPMSPPIPRFDRTVAEATGYVPRTLLATPLTDAQGTLGVLEVLDRRGGTFTMRDLDIAGALAQEAAVIVRAGMMARDATRLLHGALIGARRRRRSGQPRRRGDRCPGRAGRRGTSRSTRTTRPGASPTASPACATSTRMRWSSPSSGSTPCCGAGTRDGFRGGTGRRP